MQDTVQHLARPEGAKIAYRRVPGKHGGQGADGAPGVLFCGGFHSDMAGGKATFLHQRAAEAGVPFLRFDYRGHGLSDERFEAGTIGDWADDALLVLDRLAEGRQVIVGSSMGGWIALLLARARPERVAGLVLIAPAPDFPSRLIVPSLPEDALAALERDGRWDRPSDYSEEAYPLTRRLIEESRAHEILNAGPTRVDGPVHILHGTEDEIVPTAHAIATLESLEAPSAALELLKGGDHRLSRPEDLARLWARVEEVRGG